MSAVTGNPPGWRPDGNRRIPITTPKGLLARGGVLRGRCDSGECRRRVEIDLQAWIRDGHGDTSLSAIAACYLCGRLSCQFRFDPEFFQRGVPLQAYVAAEERLELRCVACNRTCQITAEAAIEALARRGRGGPNTGVIELAEKLDAPCRGCGKRRWTVALRCPPAPGTPGHVGKPTAPRNASKDQAGQ